MTKLANMTIRELEVKAKNYIESAFMGGILLLGVVLGIVFHSWWLALGVFISILWRVAKLWIIYRMVKTRAARYQNKWEEWGKQDDRLD